MKFIALILVGTSFILTSYSVVQRAKINSDSAARTDYAELVNSCYEQTQTREQMYSCIATK